MGDQCVCAPTCNMSQESVVGVHSNDARRYLLDNVYCTHAEIHLRFIYTSYFLLKSCPDESSKKATSKPPLHTLWNY